MKRNHEAGENEEQRDAKRAKIKLESHREEEGPNQCKIFCDAGTMYIGFPLLEFEACHRSKIATAFRKVMKKKSTIPCKISVDLTPQAFFAFFGEKIYRINLQQQTWK